MAKKGTYTSDELVARYRRYAELKGWNTTEEVVHDKVQSWLDSRIGPVGLAIRFQESGEDDAKHLGYDAEEKAAGSRIQPLVVSLKGTEHPNKDGSSRETAALECAFLDGLRLRREPDNEYDANAVAVCRDNGHQLGYLARQVAAETVARIESGYRHRAVIREVKGDGSSGLEVVIVLFILHPDVSAAEWEIYYEDWAVKTSELRR